MDIDVNPPAAQGRWTHRLAGGAVAVFLGFNLGWAAAITHLSSFVTEPWGWFWLLNKPHTALAFGLVTGLGVGLIYWKKGLAPLAPLALAIIPAAPFMPAWISFFQFYQSVAVDLAWPLLALAFFGTAFNLIPRRQAPWPINMDNPWAARIINVALPIAFVVIAASMFYTGEKLKRGAGFTGDSPQYLLVADALVMDHSVDLMPAILREDHTHWIEEPVGGHGQPYNAVEHYSKYKTGYPAVISPFVAIGWLFHADLRLLAIYGTFLFGAAVTWQLWELLHRDVKLSPSASAMGVASVMFTFPMLAYGSQVYPEMFAALMVTLALRLLTQADRAGAGSAVAMGVVMGLLLFLHDRFAFFGLPAIAAYFWLTRKAALRVWPPFLATLALFAALNIYDLHARHFPIVPKEGTYGRTTSFWNSKGVYIGWLGVILDKAHGALAYAPVFLLAPAFLLGAAKARPKMAISILTLMAIPCLLVLSFEEWWAGTSPPGGRYVVAYYPALAIFAGIFWQTRPARWVYWLFFLLLGTGLVIGHNFFLYAKEDYLVHQC
ncbi:MAG: hypothetical protein OEV92_12745, partial [Nitrospinota bacterium]|nr:hypothetical protein [Nitrospinota bacterium]